MLLSETIKTQIKSSFTTELPSKEHCGIILDGEAIRLSNVHHDPENNFTISPDDLSNYNWQQVQGIWHTHHKDTQSGYFSYPDIKMSHQSQKPIILYHTAFDVWDYYEPNNPDAFPLEVKQHNNEQLEFYLNTRFHWGRSDCFEIVRRYYLGVLKIEIGSFIRPDMTDFPSLEYQCPWNMDGFNLLPLGTQPQLHDMFGMTLRGGRNVNHAMILIKPEENIMFHSVSPNSVSRLEQYGESWRRRTLLHGRLKELC